MKEQFENEMKLEFLNKGANEAFARITVAAFASQLDPTIEELADIKTAVSEAVTNCIIHAYENRQGIIKINAQLKGNEIINNFNSSQYMNTRKISMQIMNMPKDLKIGLYKYDQTTNAPMSAVSFKVTKTDINSGASTQKDIVTETNGSVIAVIDTFNTSLNGKTIKYTIHENQTPTSYRTMEDVVFIIRYNADGSIASCNQVENDNGILNTKVQLDIASNGNIKTMNNVKKKERNIEITAEIDGDYRKNRELLYRVFPKGRTGTLEYSEDGDVKTITYRVESVTPGATTGVVRDYTISLICTDPYFKDLSDVEVVMASWVSDWYFENGFDINGVEFGHREAELVKEIENNNGADNIGITAIFRADGIVKNPAIYHSESGKYIKVGYTGNDFELQSGQYVVIFTHTGKKNIYLLDGVSQAEIEEHKDRYGMIDWDTVVSMYGTIINQYLDEDGDFIQLQDGTNTITYNAESGINYLSVSVYYRISYLGV